MDFIKKLKILRCKFLLLSQRNITLGKNSTFGRGTVLWAPNKMTKCSNLYIGKYCTLQADITLVSKTVISNNVGLI